MNEKNDFNRAFKLSTVSLLLSGITTTDLRVNKYVNIFVKKWLFVFNTLWLQTDVFGEIIWIIKGYKNGVSLLDLFLNAPCVIICDLTEAKLTPIYLNSDVLKAIIDRLRDLHPQIDDDIELSTIRDIVKESIKLIRLIGGLVIGITACVTVLFVLLPLIYMALAFLSSGELELILPYQTEYIFLDTGHFLTYIILYVHQFHSTVIAGVNIVSFDTTFSTLCAFIQMHFRLLSHSFEKETVFERGMPTDKLVELLLRHQETLRLVKQMDFLFSKSTLFQMMTGSILICLCLFNLAFNQYIGNAIIYFFFLTMSVIQIYLMCYFGDMLLTSSTEFSKAVYRSKWYKADVRVRKFILFVLMRAQMPCKITAAGFADLRMTTFTSIMSTSWSYFALLRTMLQRER